MSEIGNFIDIERLSKWLYCHREYIGDNVDSLIRSSTCKNWLRYEKFPTDNYLDDINELISNPKDKFDKINVADLLICVNNAIDINKGQKLQTITSTGKKVMMLLLLGRILDGKNKNGLFVATKDKDLNLWNYLTSFNKSNNKIKINLFYYFPGRTVSLTQLKNVGKKYRNGMKDTAIIEGIKELLRVDLVSCVDEEHELYKLNFNGCKTFLDNNK